MQTVVGVFDSVEEAQDARESLIDSGFSASEVQVQSNPAAMGGDDSNASERLTTTDSTITSTPRSASGSHQDEGVMAGIGRFFSDMFGGNDSEQAGHYSEAVRRGSSVVAVTVADDSRIEAARSALAAAGAVDIDKRTESWRQDGYSGFNPSAQAYQPDQIAAERSRYQTEGRQVADGTVLPVVREDLEVGKREADLGTVRVFSRTETRPVQEQVQLHEERAEIERRTVDRPATEADLKAFEGGSIEIQETAERAIVSKTARVVEEVMVGTESSTRTETVNDQLRSTVVEVDKTGTNTTGTNMTSANLTGAAAAGDMGMTSPDYRSHYQSNMSSLGGRYEDYEPAYQYGSTLRSDPRYADRSWDDVEADAQRDWTSRNPGGASTWEKTKMAVKHGWESMTGRR